jgi:hypothetical protein
MLRSDWGVRDWLGECSPTSNDHYILAAKMQGSPEVLLHAPSQSSIPQCGMGSAVRLPRKTRMLQRHKRRTERQLATRACNGSLRRVRSDRLHAACRNCDCVESPLGPPNPHHPSETHTNLSKSRLLCKCVPPPRRCDRLHIDLIRAGFWKARAGFAWAMGVGGGKEGFQHNRNFRKKCANVHSATRGCERQLATRGASCSLRRRLQRQLATSAE